MFAAGVTNNFAITIVAFLLLFGPVIGSIAVVDGVPVGDVAPGSSATTAGIERGNVITSVNGQPVDGEAAFDAVLANTSDRTVEIGRQDGSTVTVNRTLLLTRAVPSVLDGRTPGEGVNLGGDTPPRITAVNGSRVYTTTGLQAALENRTVATLSTTAGNATLPVGAFVSPAEDGPFEGAGGPVGGSLVVTEFGDTRTSDADTLQQALAARSPGETVTVTAYVVGDDRAKPETYRVTLDEGEGPDDARLGVFIRPGTSGLTVDDFGIDVYPAEFFLTALGGSGGDGGSDPFTGSIVQRVIFVLGLPLISVIFPNVAYNFAGFTPLVAGFYVPKDGAWLGAMGGWLFTFANVLFWTGWINLQLGFFNCIPSFPLDGGHILRTSTEAVVSRLPIEGGRRLTTAVTIATSLVMIAGLFLMIFAPSLLSG
jgi:hypothetical protein